MKFTVSLSARPRNWSYSRAAIRVIGEMLRNQPPLIHNCGHLLASWEHSSRFFYSRSYDHFFLGRWVYFAAGDRGGVSSIRGAFVYKLFGSCPRISINKCRLHGPAARFS